MKHPLVSIIVTTKNEASHIAGCLESIRKQMFKNTETIVVDNHSVDNTREIAGKFTRHVYDAGPERSAQRNFGAARAKGEYLLFLDADMQLTPDVVKECVEVCKKNKIAAVVPEKSFGIGFWAKCKALERACYEGVDWIESARFFRKDAFLYVGGYDETLTGPEDFELPQRIKTLYGVQSVGRIRAYILHDEGHLCLSKLLRKKYYYGKKMRRYRNLSESKPFFAKQANIFRRYALFFRHPQMFIADPLHMFGVLIMKTLEMAVIGLGGL